MNRQQWFRTAIAIGVLVTFSSWSSPSLAAPIHLLPAYPDLTMSGGSLSYSLTKVCQNPGSGMLGNCSGPRTLERWDLSYGRLTVTGSTMTVNPGSGPLTVSGGNYQLQVIFGFNAAGTAVTGILATDPYSGDAVQNSSLGALGTTGNPHFQSGTLVTGIPVNATGHGYPHAFGYAGSGSSGVFEFLFAAPGGDFGAIGGGGPGRIIITASSFTGASGSWEGLGVNFWKASHSSAVSVHTVVPVPAAAWLMGSALLGLVGLRLRRGLTAT